MHSTYLIQNLMSTVSGKPIISMINLELDSPSSYFMGQSGHDIGHPWILLHCHPESELMMPVAWGGGVLISIFWIDNLKF
jgi:hypothetical protein